MCVALLKPFLISNYFSLKIATHLYFILCVLVSTFFSLMTLVYSPPGSHVLHVTCCVEMMPRALVILY